MLKNVGIQLHHFLNFLGFGQLVHQKAVSKFVEFALTWRYTGKGYEAPAGMIEPFSGYDTIINSLMGHPLCKARMEKEAKAWERKHIRSLGRIYNRNHQFSSGSVSLKNCRLIISFFESA